MFRFFCGKKKHRTVDINSAPLKPRLDSPPGFVTGNVSVASGALWSVLCVDSQVIQLASKATSMLRLSIRSIRELNSVKHVRRNENTSLASLRLITVGVVSIFFEAMIHRSRCHASFDQEPNCTTVNPTEVEAWLLSAGYRQRRLKNPLCASSFQFIVKKDGKDYSIAPYMDDKPTIALETQNGRQHCCETRAWSATHTKNYLVHNRSGLHITHSRRQGNQQIAITHIWTWH